MTQRTSTEMRPIVDAYSTYEGIKRTFCVERGIKMPTLDYWRRKLYRGLDGEFSHRFVALEVDRFATNLEIEFHYPNGNRLVMPQGTSLTVLQALVKTCC